MKKQLILSAMLLGGTGILFAQEKHLEEEKNPLTISGYAEAYYLQDFNRPLTNTRPGFVYSHSRTNEVNINLAFMKANYGTENVRANLAVAAGTYMNANYAAEPGVLKNLYEANVGVKISRKHDLWIDAGLFPSHIGFESAIGKDNWTLTRSLLADNSPYFETGAKISYTSPSGNWFISGLVLNGWQRIQRVDGNTTPAFGHQLTYKPSDKVTLNSSSFIGSDKPDSARQMRYFHNLYVSYQVIDLFGITAGFDIGAEQQEKSSRDYNTWYAPVLIARYSPTETFSLTARGEYYQDKQGVIIATGTANGFRTWGYSLNADCQLLPNVVWRAEVRHLSSKDELFIKRDGAPTANNVMAVTALAVAF
ncbi:porin [Parapedobacter sp. DT-150]|uniref:porin n=1 Tax=Parapedobacter sp. DT-150 TaxID=3396162 RepID=UPI003F1AC6A1